MTYLQVSNDHIINTGSLQQWREKFLDQDDVFHADFLKLIVFGGIDTDYVRFGQDVENVFEKWNTLKMVCEPGLNIANGTYYAHKGLIHSVSKVYPDRQLAFVQATWPSLERDGWVSHHLHTYIPNAGQ